MSKHVAALLLQLMLATAVRKARFEMATGVAKEFLSVLSVSLGCGPRDPSGDLLLEFEQRLEAVDDVVGKGVDFAHLLGDGVRRPIADPLPLAEDAPLDDGTRPV